jgi:mycothiol system anti-sigma-R factor
MDCDKAIYRVYGYLDGELTFYRRWSIRRHLDKCPPCAQGFDFEIELRQVVSSKCRDEVPEALRRRIAAILDQQVLDEQARSEGRDRDLRGGTDAEDAR